jgi:hypothetical protein
VAVIVKSFARIHETNLKKQVRAFEGRGDAVLGERGFVEGEGELAEGRLGDCWWQGGGREGAW